ncbi:MAG: hypothetical protein KKF27_20865 [Gammaproteobacteria bacterium]|nr:hypothetical protein [Gammaproteobacteria bacterium]
MKNKILLLSVLVILISGCIPDEELITTTIDLHPTHRCGANELELTCLTLSTTLKTCYTESDNKGGKRCLEEPYWQEIKEELTTCPECLTTCPECPICKTCPICPDCKTTVCPTCPACDSCCKSGGGGGSSGCSPCNCPTCLDCDKVNVVAYTDNGKWFCDGIGIEANCIKDGSLEMPFS